VMKVVAFYVARLWRWTEHGSLGGGHAGALTASLLASVLASFETGWRRRRKA
jgi:hypothetical protein